MDPLSIATAVLTCMSATNTLISTVKKLHNLRRAPKEIEELENEISALRSTSESMNAILQMPSGSKNQVLQHVPVTTSIDAARKKIDGIQRFLETTLLAEDSSAKIQKSAWLKWQSEFNRLRQELRDSRIELGTCMNLFSACVPSPSLLCVFATLHLSFPLEKS